MRRRAPGWTCGHRHASRNRRAAAWLDNARGAGEPGRVTHLGLRLCAVLALLAASGCFVAEVRIAADGSGTMDLRYVPLMRATSQSERARFSAPGVTVESVAPDASGAHLLL